MAENDEKQNNRQTADVTASPEGEAALPETNTTKQKVLKALQIAGDVLFCLIIAFALFVLIISVSAKRDADGTANVFGYQLRFVRSGSMEKCDQTDVSGYKIKSIPVKSCVFIKKAPAPEDQQALNEWCSALSVGDVLTFQYSKYGAANIQDKVITHRIVKIEPKEGGYIITLEGDNKNDTGSVGQQVIDTTKADGLDYIIGKVEGQSYFLGLCVYALKSPVGLVFIIIVPCMIVIAYEVIKIVTVLNKDKKDRQQQEKTAKEDEIALLRKQLEELQKSGGTADAPRQNSDAETETSDGE
ncbi:MAG: hypothetical protein KH405_00905 [Firmicutes bacterium]|nr:hypothetical protein [Bacillota bacterium]